MLPWVPIFERLELLRRASTDLKLRAERLAAGLSIRKRWRHQPLFTQSLLDRLEWLCRILGALSVYLDGQLGAIGDSASRSALSKEYLENRHSVQLAQGHVTLLEHIILQRSNPEDDPEWLTFIDRGLDFSGLETLYAAADAVSLGLYEDVFGPLKKVEPGDDFTTDSSYNVTNWPPVAMFSSTHGYQVFPTVRVTTIPASHLFMTRYWTALAHEIAHIKVAELFDENGALTFKGDAECNNFLSNRNGIANQKRHACLIELLGPNYAQVVNAIRHHYYRLTDAVAAAHSAIIKKAGRSKRIVDHCHEFLSDAIAVHIMGPAYLYSFLGIAPEITSMAQWASGRNWSTKKAHPPELVRIELMVAMLKHAGFEEAHDSAEAVKSLSSEHARALDEWLRVVPRISEESEQLANYLARVQKFDQAAASTISDEKLIAMNPELGLTPRFTLNFAWRKRMMDYELTRSVGFAAACGPLPGIFGAVIRHLCSFGVNRLRDLNEE